MALPSGDGSESGSSGDETSGESTTGELPPPEPVPPNTTPPPQPDPTTGGGESSSGSSTGSIEPEIWEDVPPWELPEQCAWLAEEQAYCLYMRSGAKLYGLDSGEECDIGNPDAVYANSEYGLAWMGMSTAACVTQWEDESVDESVLRITRLDTGETADIPTACSHVTSERDILYIAPDLGSAPFRAYNDYADVVSQRPSREFSFDPGIHRLSIADGVVWRAWHSTDTLQRYSLELEEPLPDLAIPEHDAWVNGFSVVNDIAVVGNTDGLFGPTTLGLFDADSGVLLEQRSSSASFFAGQLNCRSTFD